MQNQEPLRVLIHALTTGAQMQRKGWCGVCG